VIFWFFGNIARGFSLYGTPSFLYVLKFPSNLFDLGTSTLIFAFLKKKMEDRWALIYAATYLFNPSTIFNISIWGQFDAIYTFFVVSSLILILEEKPVASLIVYGLAVLSKHQALVFMPVIFFFLIRRFSWRKILSSLASFAITLLVFIVPFNWKNPLSLALGIYLGGYGHYNFTSLNAFNLWALVGFSVHDNRAIFPFVTYQIVGWLLFSGVLIMILYHVNKFSSKHEKALLINLTGVLYFAFFMFLTRIHERYLFPAIALYLLSMTYDKKQVFSYGVITATFLFNQAYALFFLNKGMFVPNGDPLAVFTSIVNLITVYFSMKSLTNREKLWADQ
jgi:Gpi18-like mannosyltransferase